MSFHMPIRQETHLDTPIYESCSVQITVQCIIQDSSIIKTVRKNIYGTKPKI